VVSYGIGKLHKQLPFYFCVYFEGLPQQKKPRVLCWGSSPNFICSHVPMEIFLFYEMRKKGGNEKRVVCIGGGGSCTHVFSWGFGNTLGLTPWSAPPSEEKHHTGTSPTTFKCSLSIHHLSCMVRWWVLIHSGLGEHLHMVLGPLCSTIRCGSLDAPCYVWWPLEGAACFAWSKHVQMLAGLSTYRAFLLYGEECHHVLL
jgi:hypothetical protein